MNISNRTILITGGTGGIGLGLASALLQEKNKVIICGRDQKKLAEVKTKYPAITTILCDVGNGGQRKELAREVLQRFPDLDILINNAGIQKNVDLKKGYDELKSGEDEISINFIALVEMTSLFIGHLLKKPSAAVINVGSTLAFMPQLVKPIYCATKAAVHTYTVVLREQLKDTSVKVIEIIPPKVDTGLNAAGRAAQPNQPRGISVAEFIPAVINGFKNDSDIIFYGNGAKILSEPRGEVETRLLKQSG